MQCMFYRLSCKLLDIYCTTAQTEKKLEMAKANKQINSVLAPKAC